MNSLAINAEKRPQHFALTLAFVLATVLFALQTANTQQLQKGVSVVMAVTRYAAPMPEADNQDAWIVTLTADGSLFFGTDPVTPESLADVMKNRPRNRQAKLYIKADSRAPFANVERVLEASRTVSFETAVLLTSQPQPSAPGTIVPPIGLEVLVGTASSAVSAESIVVQLNSGQPSPALKVNNEDASWAGLQNTLRRVLQNRSEKVVLVKVAGPVKLTYVAYVIDVARSAGAQVALPSPTL